MCHDLDIQSILFFPYGSQIYGTATEKSDHDFNAVLLEKHKSIETGRAYRNNNLNVNFYTSDDWQNQLNDHKIHALEAYYLPNSTCRANFKLELNLKTLRHSLSEKSSHSFVKAKKKIEVEKDFYVGWKSLFHSLRILTFGIQIAESGSITDYSAANQHWFEIIRDPHYEWSYYDQKYKPIFNELSTKFRKVAPK